MKHLLIILVLLVSVLGMGCGYSSPLVYETMFSTTTDNNGQAWFFLGSIELEEIQDITCWSEVNNPYINEEGGEFWYRAVEDIEVTNIHPHGWLTLGIHYIPQRVVVCRVRSDRKLRWVEQVTGED